MHGNIMSEEVDMNDENEEEACVNEENGEELEVHQQVDSDAFNTSHEY